MRQKILMTLAALAFAATAVAGDWLVVPLPLRPDLVVPSWAIEGVRDMSTVYVHSEWVVDRFLHIEVVTDGIQINWIGETPWFAVSPEPNAYLPYNPGFGSYCRYMSGGESGSPGWECVSRINDRGVVYQRFEFSDSAWERRTWRFDRLVGQ